MAKNPVIDEMYTGVYNWAYSHLRSDLNWSDTGSYDISDATIEEACRRQNVTEEAVEYIMLRRSVAWKFHGENSWIEPYQAFLRYLESKEN